MCFTTVWMSSRNIFMRSKGRIPSKKGPHNGAQVDRGGQQDGGKLRNTVTHGIVFTMNPTVRSHSATLIHFNHWFIRFCIIRFVCFFLHFSRQEIPLCQWCTLVSISRSLFFYDACFQSFWAVRITVIPLELYFLRKSLPAVLKCTLGGGTSGPVMRC